MNRSFTEIIRWTQCTFVLTCCLGTLLTVVSSAGSLSHPSQDSQGRVPAPDFRRMPIDASEPSSPALFGLRIGDVLPWGNPATNYPFRAFSNGRCLHSNNLGDIEGIVFEFEPGPNQETSFFDHVCVVLDPASNSVACVSATRRFCPEPNSGNSLSRLIENLFDSFGHCETVLGAQLWDSGHIYHVFFYPSDEMGIALSWHTQFGVELVLFKVDGLFDRWWLSHSWDTFKEGMLTPTLDSNPFYARYAEFLNRRPEPREIVRSALSLDDSPISTNRFRLATTGSFRFQCGTNDWDVDVRFPDNYRIVPPQSCTFEIRGPGTTKLPASTVKGTAVVFDSQASAISTMLDRIATEGFPVAKAAHSYHFQSDVGDLCLISTTANRFRCFALFGNILVELKNDCSERVHGDGQTAEAFSNRTFLSRVFAELVTPASSPRTNEVFNSAIGCQTMPPDWMMIKETADLSLDVQFRSIQEELQTATNCISNRTKSHNVNSDIYSFQFLAGGLFNVRNHAAVHLRNLTLPPVFDAAYAEVLSMILAATNRQEVAIGESKESPFEMVWAVFQNLPPRKEEEPNAWETWSVPPGRIADSLVWIPRERNWIMNYVTCHERDFSFIPIRDRLEHHLARVHKIRKIRNEFQKVIDYIDFAHYANCTNLFLSAHAHATNLLAKGEYQGAIVDPTSAEEMLTGGGANADGRYDKYLLLLNEELSEFYRLQDKFVASFALSDPAAYIGPFRQRVLKKGTPSGLSKRARDLELAKDALSFAKEEKKHGRWITAVTFLRIARMTVDRNLSKENEDDVRLQQGLATVLATVDETERQLLEDRVEKDCLDANRLIAEDRYILALRPLDRLENTINLVNSDGRYDDLLERLENIRDESRRIQTEKAEARRLNGLPF